jgi:CBS domain-containing protein
MPIGEICNREVVVLQRDDTVLEAAKVMRQHHVGNIVVVEDSGSSRTPLGIVTDRDLVVEIMATELKPDVLTVGDIMVPGLVSVNENTGVFEAIQFMRGKGVRRLPVENKDGALVGIVTLDDLLELLSEEMLELARLVKNEQKRESILRR